MKKYMRVLFATIIGFSLTFTMVATTSAISSDNISSYGHQLVLQLNKASDPVEFWNKLDREDQKIIADSLITEIDYKTDVIENSTRNDDFTEITVIVSGYYYGEKVWDHRHIVGWWYDYTYINAWYRYSTGNGAGYGALRWVYIGEIDHLEDYQFTYLDCMSKGYWEVQIYPGVVVNTFDHVIETTHYTDGSSD